MADDPDYRRECQGKQDRVRFQLEQQIGEIFKHGAQYTGSLKRQVPVGVQSIAQEILRTMVSS